MRWICAVVTLLHFCLAYDHYGDRDYWYRCSDPQTLEIWIMCNLKKVIEENAVNTTREIMRTLRDEMTQSLERQEKMLQRILAITQADSEVKKPLDCAGLKPNPRSLKPRWIHPKSCNEAVSVKCEENIGVPETYILSRGSYGSTTADFYMPWEDYRQGFVAPRSSYWIGLETLHQITKDREFRLYVYGYDYNYRYGKGIWNKFRVLGEDKQYELQIGDFDEESTIHDCLSSLNGMKFTTFDRDNDVYSEGNCGEVWKGGWWYSDCGLANPTGPIGNSSDHLSILWHGWSDSSPISMRDLYMTIIPKDGQPLHRKCYGKEGLLDLLDLN